MSSNKIKIPKTNAARLLDKLGLNYGLLQGDYDLNDLSAVKLAATLGEDPRRVFKTIVLRGDKTGVLMACLPAPFELDLKALAKISGNKQVDLVPLKEVQSLTGYLRGGCSPLAAKKNYPVFLDSSALDFPLILISAGLRGVQLELAPQDLKQATLATLAPLTRAREDT